MLNNVYDDLVKKVNDIKTTDTNALVKKAEYDKKIGDIEKKITDQDHGNRYVTTDKFSRLTAVNSRLKQANLARKWYCWFYKKYRFWW